MSSYVIISVLAASLISTNGVTLTKEAQAIEVGAKGNQLMRNVNFAPPDKDSSADKPKDKDTTADKSADKAVPDADAVAKAVKKGPVSISLYYETRCPDCIQFINQTLAPLWANAELRANLNITMNPYGNSESIPTAKVSEGYKFFHPETTGKGWDYVHISQHGSDEALGNLIQACAIEKVEQSKHMELVFCMASQPDWGIEKAAYECMDKAKIDQKPIRECVQSPHGNQLMAEFGKKTGAVPDRKGTPWVMVGGINLVNVTDLMRSACHGMLNGPKTCAPFLNDKIVAAAPAAKAPVEDDTFTVLDGMKREVAPGCSLSGGCAKKEVAQKELVQLAMNMPTDI